MLAVVVEKLPLPLVVVVVEGVLLLVVVVVGGGSVVVEGLLLLLDLQSLWDSKDRRCEGVDSARVVDSASAV